MKSEESTKQDQNKINTGSVEPEDSTKPCNCRGNMDIRNPNVKYCKCCGGLNPSWEDSTKQLRQKIEEILNDYIHQGEMDIDLPILGIEAAAIKLEALFESQKQEWVKEVWEVIVKNNMFSPLAIDEKNMNELRELLIRHFKII